MNITCALVRLAACTPFLILVFASSSASAWDPNAGYVPAWTDTATLSVTSNPDAAASILDRDPQTHWQSGGCLPTGFIQRPELNSVLSACAQGRCAGTGDLSSADNATNGDVYTSHRSEVESGSAWFEVALPAAQTTDGVWIRGTFGTNTSLEVKSNSGTWATIQTLGSSNNITLSAAAGSDPITHIRISGTQAFQISILATKVLPCFEEAVLDFGQIREVAFLRTRHWSPDTIAGTSELRLSQDGTNWTTVAQLDSSSLATPMLQVDPPIDARYLSLYQRVPDENYKKVYVWEIDAWDRHGPWGPGPAAELNPTSFRELLGVNGIWGWGHGAYSDTIAAGLGPALYAPLASHARNYHNMNWDVLDPDNVPDYAAMARGEGTEAHSWLNWDREYGAWRSAGLEITTAIQFSNLVQPVVLWDDPYQAGYGFAYAFAQHFGPTNGTGDVATIELGNEPWRYPASFLSTVIEGMAVGARAGDPAIQVAPPALQAAFPDRVTADANNYIGTRITETAAAALSALNIHLYFRTITSDGRRVGTFPENELFASGEEGIGNLHNMIRWRDANTPQLPIHVTEWGWDAEGQYEDCTFNECVSEDAQALYALRALLIFSRLGIERASWFFYANTPNCNGLFCRSGLTHSKDNGWAPKRVFGAFKDFVNRLGSAHFVDVVREDADVHAYLLGDATGTPTHVVAWRPVDISDDAALTVTLPLSESPGEASFLAPQTGQMAPLPTAANGEWSLEVTGQPLLVSFQDNTVPDPPDAGSDAGDLSDMGAEVGVADAGSDGMEMEMHAADSDLGVVDVGPTDEDDTGVPTGCTTDLECKGERICDTLTMRCVDPTAATQDEPQGCACRTTRSTIPLGPWSVALLLGLALLGRRRRRHPRRLESAKWISPN